MKISERLKGKARVFLDTAPIVYYIEEAPQFLLAAEDFFNLVETGTVTAVTSPITLAESLVVPLREGRQHLVDSYRQLIVAGPHTEFVPISDDTAQYAAQRRAMYSLSLTDAFQVAVAIHANCDALLTNDKEFKRLVELDVIVLGEMDKE